MTRKLDDYSFDASGFGKLFRGSSTKTTTPFGEVEYRKGLFDKDPTFDDQGNPLAETKAGRRIIANLNLKKLGSGLAVDHFTRIAQLENTLDMAKEAARVGGVTKGELATIAARGDETRKTSNNAGEAAERLSAADHTRTQSLPVNLEALARHAARNKSGSYDLGATAENEVANLGIAHSKARGLPYQISQAENELTQGRNNNKLINNNAIAALFQVISPGGNALLGSKGGIESLVTPFNQSTEVIPTKLDAAGNMLSAESQRIVSKDPRVMRSVIGQYGPPGSVLPKPEAVAPINTPAPANVAPIPVSQPLGAINPTSQMLRGQMASPIPESASVFSQAKALGYPGDSNADMILKAFGINELPKNPLESLMPSANQINSMRSSPEADLLRKFGINIGYGLPNRYNPSTMPMTRPFKF